MYITFNLGDAVETNVSTGLYGLAHAQGVNPTSDTVTYSGELAFDATLNASATELGTEISLEVFDVNMETIKVKDPNAKVNPSFTKEGTLNDDGTVTWTMTIDKDNSPEGYTITDTFPQGLSLTSTNPITYTTYDASGNAVATDTVMTCNTGTDYASAPEADYKNTANFDSDSRTLYINANLAEGSVDKMVISVTTDMAVGTGYDASKTDITIENTASADSNQSGLEPVTDSGSITVAKDAVMEKKGEVFSNGDISWTIEISDVNTTWLKDLVI